MQDFITMLVASAVTSTVLSGALIWLTKSWIAERLRNAIKNEYDQKLETHKAQLKAQADVELEKLKAQLSIQAAEHQVRFSKLHDKRAEVIAELYARLVQAYWDASSFSSLAEWVGEPDKKEKYAIAMNSMAAFYQFFDKARIYLPERVCSLLENAVHEMREKVTGFGVYVHYKDADLPQEALLVKNDAWKAAWEFFRTQVPAARAALESELRSILGEANGTMV